MYHHKRPECNWLSVLISVVDKGATTVSNHQGLLSYAGKYANMYVKVYIYICTWHVNWIYVESSVYLESIYVWFYVFIYICIYTYFYVEPLFCIDLSCRSVITRLCCVLHNTHPEQAASTGGGGIKIHGISTNTSMSKLNIERLRHKSLREGEWSCQRLRPPDVLTAQLCSPLLYQSVTDTVFSSCVSAFDGVDAASRSIRLFIFIYEFINHNTRWPNGCKSSTLNRIAWQWEAVQRVQMVTAPVCVFTSTPRLMIQARGCVRMGQLISSTCHFCISLRSQPVHSLPSLFLYESVIKKGY